MKQKEKTRKEENSKYYEKHKNDEKIIKTRFRATLIALARKKWLKEHPKKAKGGKIKKC